MVFIETQCHSRPWMAWALHINQAGLETQRNQPAFVSSVMGLKVYAMNPGSNICLLTYMWTYIASECKSCTEKQSKIFFLVTKILTVLRVDKEHLIVLETEWFSMTWLSLLPSCTILSIHSSSQNGPLNEVIN